MFSRQVGGPMLLGRKTVLAGYYWIVLNELSKLSTSVLSLLRDHKFILTKKTFRLVNYSTCTSLLYEFFRPFFTP